MCINKINRWWGKCLSVTLILMAGSLPCHAMELEVKGWQLPKGSLDLASRKGWSSASEGAKLSAGVVLENHTLLLVARPGSEGVSLYTKAVDGQATQVKLAMVLDGEKLAEATEIKLKSLSSDEGILQVFAKGGSIEISVQMGISALTVRPLEGVKSLEVRTPSRYAVIPDFFGYDLIYEASKFKSNLISVPAENFILNLVEGNKAMVMCIWPGQLSQTKDGTKSTVTGRDPLVKLVFEGEGEKRFVAATRIEFTGQPIYVATMVHDKMWYEKDVSQSKVLTPIEVEWARPFDAKWRVSMLVAEGKKTKDLMTRSQSYDFLYAPEGNLRAKLKQAKTPEAKVRARLVMKRWEKKTYPRVAEEGVNRHIYPAWFLQDKTMLSLYADAPSKLRGNKKDTAENIFSRALIYSLERLESTPVGVKMPVDIMRETLGKGPCEYVLDVEGIQSRRSSGQEKKIMDVATCTIWMKHIFPLLPRAKAPNTTTDEKKAYIVRAIYDLPIFVHAVRIRIEEYEAWADKFIQWIDQAEKGAELKPVAERVRALAEGLKTRMKVKYKSEHFKMEGEEWDEKIPLIAKEVEAGDIRAASKAAGIREFAQVQDHAVSDCRRFVKAIRQEVSFAEGSSVELQKFIATIREKCHQILRRGHPKEMLHSDPRTEER